MGVSDMYLKEVLDVFGEFLRNEKYVLSSVVYNDIQGDYILYTKYNKLKMVEGTITIYCFGVHSFDVVVTKTKNIILWLYPLYLITLLPSIIFTLPIANISSITLEPFSNKGKHIYYFNDYLRNNKIAFNGKFLPENYKQDILIYKNLFENHFSLITSSINT